MKKLICILIVFSFCNCNTNKLFKEYKLYRRDAYFNYPEEKLEFKFLDDTTGLFINNKKYREPIKQKFSFSRDDSNYLIVKSVDIHDLQNIGLKEGDTIILAKRHLLFFYSGARKYLLSFKKK